MNVMLMKVQNFVAMVNAGTEKVNAFNDRLYLGFRIAVGMFIGYFLVSWYLQKQNKGRLISIIAGGVLIFVFLLDPNTFLTKLGTFAKDLLFALVDFLSGALEGL